MRSSDGVEQWADGGRGLTDLWPWLLFPLLPLVAGLVALSVLDAREFAFACHDTSSSDDFAAAFLTAPGHRFVHFESLIVYASAGLVHVGLCLFAALYFVLQMGSLRDPVSRRNWCVALLLAAALVVLAVVAWFDGAALQLSYHNTCQLLCKARLALHIVPRDCSDLTNPLVWLAAVPTVAGMSAAVLAAALSSSAVAPLPTCAEAAWRSAFAERVRSLQRSFYVLSAVLITATITLMLFLGLPVPLAADDPTRLAVSAHARGMTVFWGTLFTLTLLAIFAPAVLHLMSVAKGHAKVSDAPDEVRTWMSEQVFASLPKQLGNLAALLAPLLVGPFGALLEKLLAAA